MVSGSGFRVWGSGGFRGLGIQGFSLGLFTGF